MCGLAGVVNFRGDVQAVVSRMTEAVLHRGRDDGGVWLDQPAGVGLGHRRLAIIDPSAAGHQPMVSECGRYVLIFNGEIYNHGDIRRDLEAAGGLIRWRGHSDTETLLAGVVRWGLEEVLCRAAGMFALAVWDRHSQRLQLGRDRFGEKPLYYGWAGSSFVFGSELKALQTHPDFSPSLCIAALSQYFRLAYIPAPRSIWSGVYKLEPGCMLQLDGIPPATPPPSPIRPGHSYGSIAVSRFWSLADVVEAGAKNPITDEAEAVAELEATLQSAVRRQMISDVPLGAFLSGGVDSSAIVALMQAHANRPIKTFTIGFEESEFDEAPFARSVANHLGTDHTEIRVSAVEARAVIPDLPRLFDEPFADASQIPTHLVCRAARAHVKVALTGDAGDELFGGYVRYVRVPQVWNKFKQLPLPIRRALGKIITAVPVKGWDRLRPTKPQARSGFGDKVHRLGERLQLVKSIDDLYLNLVSAWPDPAILIEAADQYSLELLDDGGPSVGNEHPAARMMYQDSMTYLPDDILCKVDRAAMGVSLETRAPLLDPDVVTLAARLPVSMKIRDNEGKWVLRQVLYKYVPRGLLERPKVGFYLPVGQWLRGPLREWAETLLAPNRIVAEGFLNPEPIRMMWVQHVTGVRDWTAPLWTVLMFQAWLEANIRFLRTASNERLPEETAAARR